MHAPRTTLWCCRYLVPFTVGTSFLTAAVTGQTGALLAYNEAPEEEEEEGGVGEEDAKEKADKKKGTKAD